MNKLLILILLLVGIAAGFAVANYLNGDKAQTFVQHDDVVREIAELSALEVQGTAKITETNVKDGSWFTNLKNYMSEQTLVLDIPYTAKYGSHLGDSTLSVDKVGKNRIKINLNEPRLLSFEMHLDKMSQFSKNGLFILDKDNRFEKPQKKLYEETRNKLQNNEKHLASAKVKVEKTLRKLCSINGVEVEFNWIK